MSENPKLYQRLDSYIKDSRTEFENKLAQVVEVPTVSMDPEHKEDCR